MKYVYLLESIDHPEESYVGLTDDLRTRFEAHNSGQSPRTAKFKPWRLVTYVAFPMKRKLWLSNVTWRRLQAARSQRSD